MRMYAKRLALVVFGALGTTILVSVMNSLSDSTLQGRDAHFVGAASSKESAAIVGGLKPLQKQSPESAVLTAESDRRQKTSNIDAAVEVGRKKPTPIESELSEKKSKTAPKQAKLQEPIKTDRTDQAAIPLVPEGPWAKDDQVLVPTDSPVASGKKKRVLDPAVVALKEKLHLDEFRVDEECSNRTTLADYYWSKYRYDQIFYLWEILWMPLYGLRE